jgi:hypothetical protein
MDTSRLTSIKFLTWVGQYCIYIGDGFWIYYKRFYTVEELFDKYSEIIKSIELSSFESKLRTYGMDE